VSLTQSERDILTHCLGYNYSPQQERNQYLTEVGSADCHVCMALVKRGLMTKGGTVDLGVAETVFTATPAGEALVKPRPRIMTRSQRRYRRYLDIREVRPDLSFIEFCEREREFYP